MFKLDGSQTSWLVYADWLEDQEKPANHIRDLATEIKISDWVYESPPDQAESIGNVGFSWNGRVRAGSGYVNGSYVGYQNTKQDSGVGSYLGSQVGSRLFPEMLYG